jgi:hypothetical protein
LINNFEDKIIRYRKYPDKFIEEMLGVELRVWQKVYLRMLMKLKKGDKVFCIMPKNLGRYD